MITEISTNLGITGTLSMENLEMAYSKEWELCFLLTGKNSLALFFKEKPKGREVSIRKMDKSSLECG
jgi:hypothetical protein